MQIGKSELIMFCLSRLKLVRQMLAVITVQRIPAKKPKNPAPKDQTRGAIYSIPCQVCEKTYIGETKRKFSTRLKEHQKAVVNTRTSQL